MFTAQHLYFDDLEIGQTFTSSGRTVTETDIVNFAGVSGDFNSIHVDHAFAATTSFRRPSPRIARNGHRQRLGNVKPAAANSYFFRHP